jgi:tRNA (guanosine-2'-O-)-methyltransferase
MTPERFDRLRRTLARRQTSLTVLMENVHKPHNYSAVLRSCDAVGIHRAHAVATDKLVQTHEVTSASASRYVHVAVHSTIGEACAHLHAGGFRILAAHLGEAARDFREADYTTPSAILLGTEREGLSAEAAGLADEHVIIPMEGLVRSLNVSVACAVILFEAQRQRRAAGLYDRPQVPAPERERLLFEWGYPDIASWCRRHDKPYPALDEAGEIIGDFRLGG